MVNCFYIFRRERSYFTYPEGFKTIDSFKVYLKNIVLFDALLTFAIIVLVTKNVKQITETRIADLIQVIE